VGRWAGGQVGRWGTGFGVPFWKRRGRVAISNFRSQIQEAEASQLSTQGFVDCSIDRLLDSATAQFVGFHHFVSVPFRLLNFSTPELSTLDFRRSTQKSHNDST
jgi:hypothetical protein